MKLYEITKLHDVMKLNQYIALLRHLDASVPADINAARIKNSVLQSWGKGMKSRKHYADLLGTININLGDIIDK